MMLLRALELGHPETMLEVLYLHTELLYHPHPNVVNAYFQHFLNKDYESLKKFFEATKGNYFMIKPKGFYEAVIDKAHDNGDKKTVVEAYL
jgi:hypothetical protein